MISKRHIDTVFVHCSASDNPKHDSVDVIKRWHLARGWSDVGYHYFIRKDGEMEFGRSVDRTPAAQRGHNVGSVAICLSGLAEFTMAQAEELIRHSRRLQKLNGCARLRFRGHNEVSRKSCPVFDYATILQLDKDGHLP
jgi:N-acetylmuramoyl-L-alanine amidase